MLLGATAGSASAATWTPASWDFGKVPVGSEFAYKDFTLTKGAETTFEVGLGIREKLNIEGGVFQGQPAGAGIECPSPLTNSFPSCNIRIYFTPRDPGRVTGSLLSDRGAYGPPDPAAPIAALSGVGVQKCKRKKQGRSATASKKKCKKR
ncbi:MAG: hypothetical protein ACXWDQ_01190 [Solirubrobacterales bacterium]